MVRICTPVRGCTPASSNAGKDQNRRAEQEGRQAEETQRTADERARDRQVIAENRRPAARRARRPTANATTSEMMSVGTIAMQRRVQVDVALEEALRHAMQDSR